MKTYPINRHLTPISPSLVNSGKYLRYLDIEQGKQHKNRNNMLRQNFSNITLFFAFFTTIFPLTAQSQTVEIHQHFYENIHLISYPVVEFETRSNQPLQEYEYEFEVFPGGDVSDIHFNYGSCQKIEILANGSLQVSGPLGNIFEAAPYAYQESVDGEKVEVDIKFNVENNEVKLVASSYEMAQILTIKMKSIKGSALEMTTRGLNMPNQKWISYIARN